MYVQRLVETYHFKQKLQPYYQQIGITSQNTYVTFSQDGTYSALFDGKAMQGNWTFDESTCKVTMQGLLLSLNCYAKRNVDGIGLDGRGSPGLCPVGGGPAPLCFPYGDRSRSGDF